MSDIHDIHWDYDSDRQWLVMFGLDGATHTVNTPTGCYYGYQLNQYKKGMWDATVYVEADSRDEAIAKARARIDEVRAALASVGAWTNDSNRP